MLPTPEPRSIKLLDENEMMGEVRKLTLPTTLDTGAHYTLIPEEMVDPKDFTGKTAKLNLALKVAGEDTEDRDWEGKEAIVQIKIAGKTITRWCIAFRESFGR